MLDIKFIKENKDLVAKAIVQKGLKDKVDLEGVLSDYGKYLDLLRKVETHRNLKNTLSKDISKVSPNEKSKLMVEAKKVKEELQTMEEKLDKSEKNLNKKLQEIPNVIAEDVPFGESELENEVIREWGKTKDYGFTPKMHEELGVSLDLIDIKTSAKVSGSRFNYLKNEAVLIQFALISFVFDVLQNEKLIKKIAKKTKNPSDKIFSPILPPVMIKAEIAKKMDRYDPIDDRYYFEKDDMLLVGSAEHSMGPIFMDEVLEEADLPLRYIGYSTAFRREAGTYGKDKQGILRRHQFDKLEMETFSDTESGLLEQDLIVALQEHIVQQLEIPYQVVMICSGDMGKPDFRQIDINCWFPGEGRYVETHTSDYMTDFQARRLNTRYKTKEGETKHVHMNDATAFAIGRILAAILENYQQKDGSVLVPKVLQKYLSFKKIDPKK